MSVSYLAVYKYTHILTYETTHNIRLGVIFIKIKPKI